MKPALLVILAAVLSSEAGEPLNLRLNLKDGANFNGVPTTNSITVVTSYAVIAVPFADVRSIVSERDNVVSVVFPNGDILKGTSAVDNIRFKTEFGTIAIGLNHIKTLTIPAGAKFPDWIDDGLVAYYPFDGSADDAGTNKYHGSIQGAVPATDRFNNPKRAYRIQDRNSITLNHRALNGLRSFTISAWVCFETLNTGNGDQGNTIISVSTPGALNELLLAHGLIGAGLGVNLKGVSRGWHEFGNGAVPAREWRHIVLTRRSSDVTLYLDGEMLDSTTAAADPVSADPRGVVLGQKQDSVGSGFQANSSLTGKIDDLRIYRLALSAIKVKRLYEAEKKEF